MPTKAIYSFWKCLDIILNADDSMDFNEALDYLEKLSKEDVGEHSPLYIKLI